MWEVFLINAGGAPRLARGLLAGSSQLEPTLLPTCGGGGGREREGA